MFDPWWKQKGKRDNDGRLGLPNQFQGPAATVAALMAELTKLSEVSELTPIIISLLLAIFFDQTKITSAEKVRLLNFIMNLPWSESDQFVYSFVCQHLGEYARGNTWWSISYC